MTEQDKRDVISHALNNPQVGYTPIAEPNGTITIPRHSRYSPRITDAFVVSHDGGDAILIPRRGVHVFAREYGWAIYRADEMLFGMTYQGEIL